MSGIISGKTSVEQMFVNLLIVQFPVARARARTHITNNIGVFGRRMNYVYIFAPLSLSPPRVISAIRGL